MPCNVHRANFMEHLSEEDFQATHLHPVAQEIRELEIASKPPMRAAASGPPMPEPQEPMDWEKRWELHRKEDRLLFRRGSSNLEPGDGLL